MRRDEFTLEEYRKLHTVGRKWIGEADKPSSIWYRTVTYNMILIACNTGMRPVEMKNLRWRDIMPTKDRESREIVVLFVQGKDKSRKLVAPKSVGDYLERIRAISKVTEPDDRVFTNITGKPAKTLYSSPDCRSSETKRICAKARRAFRAPPIRFRHTYATLRLQEGVDVYFLAEQMGTSVHMIESHYGHVNTIKHADRVLQGMAGWELPHDVTTLGLTRRKRRRRTINPKRSAPQAALTVNLPKPSLAGAAGGGWRREFISNSSLRILRSDLPLPRRGVLSGKSPRTSRRWRLFFVRFVSNTYRHEKSNADSKFPHHHAAAAGNRAGHRTRHRHGTQPLT